MSYIYNREKPGCTCPRCRFAAANSQPRRTSAESEIKIVQEKREAAPAPSFTQLEKASLTAKRPMSEGDMFESSDIPPIKKRADKKAAHNDSASALSVDGSMESFDGSVPEGWSTETPELISREDRRGLVHMGRYSVRLRDGAQMSFTSERGSETGYELSFFAKGTGWNTGLSVVLYCVNGEGGRECASLTVRKGDLPRGRGQFGYYVLRAPSLPSGMLSVRAEFSVSADWRGSVLLDDVSLIRI